MAVRTGPTAGGGSGAGKGAELSRLPRQNSVPLATYHEQEVEVALGAMGIIADSHTGILTRRIEATKS